MAKCETSIRYDDKVHWLERSDGRFIVPCEFFQCYGLLRRLSRLSPETWNDSVTLRLPEPLHPMTSEQYVLLLYCATATSDTVFEAPAAYQNRYEEMYELFKAFEASEAVMNLFQIGWYRWKEDAARVSRGRLEAATR